MMKMRRTLLLKLIMGFALFGIVGFILVSTFTYQQTQEYLESEVSVSLSKEASLIATNYAADYYNAISTLDDIQQHLNAIDTYINARILIVNPDGQILLSSKSDDTLPESIPDFNLTDYFGSRFYQVGNLFGIYNERMLTVFTSITSNYKVQGYVIISKPMHSILGNNSKLLNITYFSLGIMCIFVFFLLGYFYFIIYRPLHQITKAADAYVNGHFEEKIDIHSNDELGYLGASLNYIANELNTLESDQRKFISNVSHDFRSPLTSIKGYVEAILDGTIPVELQDKYLNIILFETERLTKLTKNLLELNQLDGQRGMLDISRFDINQTIKTTVQTFEGICKGKRISFELFLTGAELFVRADISKIQQVLYNLIDNAIKFSPNDSFIKIETTIKNNKVFVSVKDSGIGIPKESINKIWERFYKTDLSRGKDKKGTGLGLAIVKEIITAHKENINVISTEGVGTEFIFTLPIA